MNQHRAAGDVTQARKPHLLKPFLPSPDASSRSRIHGTNREFYAHLRSSKDYDEGSAAFSERRKPEFSQEYYDEKTKLPGVPIPAKK